MELLPEFEVMLNENEEYETMRSSRSPLPNRNSTMIDMLDTSQMEYETPSSDPANCTVIGGESRKTVSNTRTEPFKFICKIEFLDSRGNVTGWCTGTLIRPDKILTAAHCLFNRGTSTYKPLSARVIPGKNGAGRSRREEPFGVATVTRFDVPDGYKTAANNRSAMPFDYGIITLKEPIGKRIGWWTRIRYKTDKFLLDHKVNTAGYPTYSSNKPVVVYDKNVTINPQTLEFLHDTCKGQSGSPIWVRWQNYRAIIGILTTLDDPNTGVIANTGVRMSSTVLDNIKRWITS